MTEIHEIGARRFGPINFRGIYTLATREALRFLNVWTQTLMAPLITAGLFLTIFYFAIGAGRGQMLGVPFMHFLAPGILTMTVIQNAFANTSSSITIAKIQGNIVDSLMPPLSASELVIGYVIGGVLRGTLVAIMLAIFMRLFLGVGIAHPLLWVLFVLLGSIIMSALGVLAGIYAQKFDQAAAITNFIITPLSFLSGTFYSIQGLPETMQVITRFNPFFYIIDGVRYSTIGRSDTPTQETGIIVCLCVAIALLFVCWLCFERGYRMKP